MFRALIAGVLVFALVFAAVARSSYFAGCEVIPHTFGQHTFGMLYAIAGYEGPAWFAKAGFSSPLTISGWYMVSLGGLYRATENLDLGAYFTLWGEMEAFRMARGAWTVGFLTQYSFDTNLALFLSFNVPLQVDPRAAFLGAWTTFGFKFYFSFPVPEPTKK